jgi:hypothetical protein
MKIVNINSGLGNQMFQFAFYLSLKDKFKNEEVKLDISWFEVEKFHNGFELKKIFNINVNQSTKKENTILSRSGYTLLNRIKRRLLFKKKSEILESNEQQFNFLPDLYGNDGKNEYYRGYWQSYKYFDSISEIVKSHFIFLPFSEKKNIDMSSFIENNMERTVSVHIRRGDYLNHKSLGGVCTLEYYQKAIVKMSEKIKNPIFIIFSNDINWCKENFNLSNIKFVDWNSGELSFRDMQLMSICGNNIIANSSFSWWGAYLNQNNNKIIIAPKIWIENNDAEDLIPNDWNRL